MNNIQPLRFYSSRTKAMATRHTAWGNNYIYPLIIDKDKLIPFCISRTKSTETEEESLSKWPITTVNIINSNTGQSQSILNKMRFLVSNTVGSGSINASDELILYPGNCDNLNLKQGKYYLEIKDSYYHSGYTSNTWYSDDFIISHIGTNDPRIKIKYRCLQNTFLDNYSWFYPRKIDNNNFYYVLETKTATYEVGDPFDVFQEAMTDIDQFNVYGFQRFAKINGITLFGDSSLMECMQFIKLISNYNGGEVLLTDETGEEKQIIITDLKYEPVANSHYSAIQMKYRNVGEEIRTSSGILTGVAFYQNASSTPTLVDADDLLRTYDKKVKTTHGKFIRRNTN